MATQGIVTTLNAPDTAGAVPGPEWLSDLAGLSPAPHHLLLRCSVSVDKATNKVNIEALRRALTNYRDAGFEVRLSLHPGVEVHYQTLSGDAYLAAMPNATLGLDDGHGHVDLLLNDYINRFSLTVVGTLLALGDLCPQVVWIWNEPNEDGPGLRPGQRPKKPQALAPEVFGAMLATTAKRVRDKCPLVARVMPGALSCLIKFDTDPHGPWVGGYLHRALDYIARHGVVAPYQFTDLSLNLEGVVTDHYAAYCAHALSDVLRDRKMTGQTVVAEWSIANHDATDDEMAATFAALNAHFSEMFFFQHPTLDETSYGATDIGISPQGEIVPRGHTPWYARFARFVSSLLTT